MLALLLALAVQDPFMVADAWADRAPAAAESSVTTLAAYLNRAGDDELTRARVLYRWVTGHIDYDAVGFRTREFGDLSPDAVLRRRAAVCQGYASLTEALGTAMGLRVRTISGWSKGYGYRAGQQALTEGPTNHAWNAVEVGGRWRLMDPTWGAGFVDEQFRFSRRFQEHYFLTPPAEFVIDHLPVDSQWQLLARPLTPAEYDELAYLRPAFFAHGLQPVSHRRARIEAAESLTARFGATMPVELMADVVDPATNRPLEGGRFAFAQAAGREAELHAWFPRAGEYLLRLFVRPRGSQEPAQWALDYRVVVSRGNAAANVVATYAAFMASGAWIEGPVHGTLRAGAPVRFQLRVPGALDVSIVQGTTWTHLTRSGDLFTAEMPPSAGPVTVFARFSDGGQYRGLLRYESR